MLTLDGSDLIATNSISRIFVFSISKITNFHISLKKKMKMANFNTFLISKYCSKKSEILEARKASTRGALRHSEQEKDPSFPNIERLRNHNFIF